MNSILRPTSSRAKSEIPECRSWINYEEDLNCTNIAIDKNGTMKLRQIAERLGLTPARVQQIEKGALAKLNKVM